MATATELQPIAEPVAPAEEPAASPSAVDSRIRRLFSVAEYERIVDGGILGADERLELIEGEILAMSPIGSRHAAGVDRATEAFAPLAGRVRLRVQGPLRLAARSVPQPDLMLLRPRADFYKGGLPTPADVLLLIEVMDTSVDFDRGVKLGLYAAADIPEVWLVDLPGDRLEVYRRPARGSYTQITIHAHGESIAPEAFPEFVVAVDAILD